jgi:hypothetical protein
MSSARVRQLLGAPTQKRRLSESETGDRITAWVYPDAGLRVEFRRMNGRVGVGSVTTTARTARTTGGVGPGTSQASLLREVSKVRCVPADADGIYCARGSSELGARQTVFQIRNGVIARVTIFIVFP